MADCHVYYDELRFNVSDEKKTHVYAYLACDGDCPFFIAGWHHKSFEGLTTHQIFERIASGEEDMMKWPRIKSPAPMEPKPRSVPVSDYGLEGN